ncbi:hypothetical protein Ahy_A02g007583 [Arachis hypogaea]|uniref:Uncharacterized protein n=1 Tax=Arachis hypogaea TaxID=3818 RepID=A0A445ECT5_ARAHY|nr:hypothetical protein Ahy_A02g007583 [Arachis hypogaea]
MAVITETTIGVIAIQYSRSSLSGIEFWVLHAEFYDCDIRHQAAALSPELPLLCSLAYLKLSRIARQEKRVSLTMFGFWVWLVEAIRVAQPEALHYDSEDVTSSAVAATTRVAQAPSIALIAFAPFIATVTRALSAVLLSYELLPASLSSLLLLSSLEVCHHLFSSPLVQEGLRLLLVHIPNPFHCDSVLISLSLALSLSIPCIALSKHGEAAKVVSEEQLIAAEMGQRIKLLQEDRLFERIINITSAL